MIKSQNEKNLKAYIILGIIWAFLSLPGYAQEPVFSPFVGQAAGDDVNIRSGENKNFEVILQVNKGKELVVIDKKYDWFKVRLPEEAKVFISGEFLEPLRDGIAKIKGSKVNVRARPALKTGIVGKLRQGTLVKIVGCQDEWCQIEAAEGMYGWVHEDLITKTSKSVPEPKRVSLPTRNVYVLKREAEEKRLKEEAERKEDEAKRTVVVSGTLKSLADKAISQEVRHYIVNTDGKTYLLQGYRNVLDGFLNQAVTLKGLPQDKTSLNYPVLLVTRITLAL